MAEDKNFVQIDPTSAFPKQEGAYCPACGRYIGAYTTCPYCGTHIKERLSVRALKIFSLAFSIIGVILLWWAAGRHMVPQIQAAEIDNRTNFAYVQMKGVVLRTPKYDAKNKTLSFQIDDGTGTVWVKAYGAQAEEIYKSGKIPAPGDTVIVEGTVRLKGDYTYLTVNLPEKLQIIKPKPVEIDIAEISDSLYGTVVKTVGIINYVRKYDNAMKLQLCSPYADACVESYFYYSSFPNLDPDQFERGDTVIIVGMVSTYRNVLQIVPRSPDEVWHKKGSKPTRTWTGGAKPPENAPKVKLGDLKKDMVGKYVAVEGTINWVKKIKGGILLQISDGTGKMTFPIWDRVLKTVPAGDKIAKGNKISFVGKVKEYKGKLEVVPEYGPGIQVTVVQGAQNSESKGESKKEKSGVKKYKIGDITESLVGQKVSDSGEILRVKKIKGGHLVDIDDGTGKITVVIWDKVWRHIKSAGYITEGNTLELVGKVKQYKGKLEIVPNWGEDVVAISEALKAQPAESQSGAPKKISLAELTEDLIGSVVTVSGEITRVKNIRGGVLVTIRDGDEYMTTPFWSRSVGEFTEDELARGKRITITGEVKKYKDRLEVVPRTRDDIVIE